MGAAEARLLQREQGQIRLKPHRYAPDIVTANSGDKSVTVLLRQ